jgi:type I restriction enzyme R subunit
VRISPKEINKKGSVPINGSIFFTIFQTFMTGVSAPSTGSGSDSARTGSGENKLISEVQKGSELVEGAVTTNEHLSIPPDPEPVEGTGPEVYSEYPADFFDFICLHDYKSQKLFPKLRIFIGSRNN